MWSLDEICPWFRRCCIKLKLIDRRRTESDQKGSPLAFRSGDLNMRAMMTLDRTPELDNVICHANDIKSFVFQQINMTWSNLEEDHPDTFGGEDFKVFNIAKYCKTAQHCKAFFSWLINTAWRNLIEITKGTFVNYLQIGQILSLEKIFKRNSL